MNNKGLVVGLSASLVVLLLAGTQAIGDAPGDAHADTGARHHAGGNKQQAGEFIKVVREATRRFRDVNQALAEGYQLHFGCVSGDSAGAMGLHYVNMDLVGDPTLDPSRPEIVIYEPLPNGGRRLIGADFLVIAEAWHANNAASPQLMGQLMHLISSPNRYGLPAFYTLHVWAWKPNPNGAFVNWHPTVSCEQFEGQEH